MTALCPSRVLIVILICLSQPAQADSSNKTACASTPLAAYTMLTGQSATDNQTSATDMININTASIAELTTLDGIGVKRAKDIVNYRLAYGDFASVDDLTKVKGIGSKTLAKFQHRLSVQ